MEITLQPIGTVANSVSDPVDEGWGNIVSDIILQSELNGILTGLESFSHAQIIYWMHETPASAALTRRPRGREDLPELGLLAQRARHRPNPIGVTAVEIVSVAADRLSVKGLDAINGTPVIDIKPYFPVFDRRDQATVPSWVNELMTGYFDAQVPAIELPATLGQGINLLAAAQSNHLVLFFYPGDGEGLRYPELRGCTAEACSFRDALGVIRDLGANVFGVSFQPTERQRLFAEREHLPFALLSDSEHRLADELKIPIWRSPAGEEFAQRTTVIVEKGGRIARVFTNVVVDGHVAEVTAALRALG